MIISKKSCIERPSGLYLTGEAKVRQLVHHLDLQKDESIERTFRGVAKNFKDIFAELVPGGNGELVMIRRAAVGLMS